MTHAPGPGQEPGRWLPWDEVVASGAGTPRVPRAWPAESRRSVPESVVPCASASTPVPAGASLTLDFGTASVPHGETWLPETSVEPSPLVAGVRVPQRTFGPGILLSAEPSGRSTRLLLRFDGGDEKWIAFGCGPREFEE